MKNIQSNKHKSGDSKRKAFIICGIAALGIIVAAAYIYIMYSVGAIAVGGKTKAERKIPIRITIKTPFRTIQIRMRTHSPTLPRAALTTAQQPYHTARE